MSTNDQTATLPQTTGRWAPIYRGKVSKTLVGYLEVFRTTGNVWVTVPGSSRWVEVH